MAKFDLGDDFLFFPQHVAVDTESIIPHWMLLSPF